MNTGNCTWNKSVIGSVVCARSSAVPTTLGASFSVLAEKFDMVLFACFHCVGIDSVI